MSLRFEINVLLLASAIFCSSGCSTLRKKPEKKPEPIVKPPAFVGTVTLVNEENGFVLIDNGLLPTPPVGLKLKSYTDGVESAELVTSPVQKRPFTIADIQQGAPRKGDRVFVSRSVALPARPVSQPGAPTTNPQPQSAPDFLPEVQLAPTP